MPVYEYECKACGRQFEYQQRMADPEKTLCEACGKEALERIISRTAFQLKGGGWYKDLYSSTKPEGAKSEGSSDSGGGEKKADAAPASSDGGAASSTPAAAPAPSTSTGTSGTSGSSTGSSGSGSSGSSGGTSAA